MSEQQAKVLRVNTPIPAGIEHGDVFVYSAETAGDSIKLSLMCDDMVIRDFVLSPEYAIDLARQLREAHAATLLREPTK